MAIFTAGVVIWFLVLIGSHEGEVQDLQAEIDARGVEISELRGHLCEKDGEYCNLEVRP